MENCVKSLKNSNTENQLDFFFFKTKNSTSFWSNVFKLSAHFLSCWKICFLVSFSFLWCILLLNSSDSLCEVFFLFCFLCDMSQYFIFKEKISHLEVIQQNVLVFLYPINFPLDPISDWNCFYQTFLVRYYITAEDLMFLICW